MGILSRFVRQREFMLIVIIAVMFVFMAFASPSFLNPRNFIALLLGLSIEAIIGVAMVNLMVSGGFDMSVGSIVGFAGASCAMLITMGVPVGLAVFVGIVAGAAIGGFNGFIIAKVGINPFVTTLASLSLFRGLTLVISGGLNISGLPDSFNNIGQGSLLGIQLPIWYVIALVAIGDLLLRNSRFFRQNYYLGGNEKAAILSGISVARMKIFNYVLTGAFAAIAGIILTSRLGSASTTAGTGLELRVITAVIIGGASLAGGAGTVLGAFLGSVLMALITNALTLLNVDIYWQTFTIGATLLIAVLIDQLGKNYRERKALRRPAA